MGARGEEELKEESEEEPSYGKVHEEFPTFWPSNFIFAIRINNIIDELPCIPFLVYLGHIHRVISTG